MTTIMVVEDDRALRSTLRAVLEFEGFQVVTAHDGQDALERLDAADPAAIVLDLAMPRLDGVGFAGAMEQRGGPPIPILVLSADLQARQKAVQIKASALLRKPFDLEALIASVRALIEPIDRNAPAAHPA